MRQWFPAGSRVVILAMSACALALTGCEAVAFFAQGMKPNAVKAIYPIADRATLVLIDDPSNLLTDPTLAGLISDRITADLQQAKAVTQFISQLHVRDLQVQLGTEFHQTPVDRIGQAVGAEQIIHITIESLQVEEGPQLWRPVATVRVKLIDAVESVRRFPPASAAEVQRGTAHLPLGHPVVSEMFYQQQPEGRGGGSIIMRRLADRIGRDVARVFHDHRGRQVGAGFED
jgi:hypothetical protein